MFAQTRKLALPAFAALALLAGFGPGRLNLLVQPAWAEDSNGGDHGGGDNGGGGGGGGGSGDHGKGDRGDKGSDRGGSDKSADKAGDR